MYVDVKYIRRVKVFLIRKDFMIFLQWLIINKNLKIFLIHYWINKIF